MLAVLLVLLPFFRGLFFTQEILLTHIVSFTLYLVYLFTKYQKKEELPIGSLLDLSVILMVLAYILPVIFGQWANLRDAWSEVIKYVNFFVIYTMVRDYASQERYKQIILSALVFSGVIVALIGLFSAMGFGQLKDAVLGGNRIASTFQYPNTLAAYLGTLIFLSFGLMERTDEAWKKVILVSAGFIMLLTFILTYSRAAWLLLPIFIIGLFILLTKESRMFFLIYLLSIGSAVIAVLQPLARLLRDQNKTGAILVLVLGISLSIGLFYGLELLHNKIKKINYRLLYIVAGVLVFLAIGVVAVAINTIQPLVYDNLTVTENRTNQMSRSISNIAANQTYTLNVEVEAVKETQEERHWPWRIQIYGLNSEDERVLLHQELGSELELTNLDISFDTQDDTDSLTIIFTNLYPGTKAIFYYGAIYDHDEALVQELKLSYRYIPESLVSRFNAISLSERSSTARLIFYKDAFKIFKDHPIVGAGGGAWSDLYEGYQSEPYISRTTHSFFMSILVDTGIIGVGVVLLILFLLLLQLYKSKKTNDNFSIALSIGILFLLGHSILDFNFSYLSILLSFGVLLGCLEIQLKSRLLPKRFPKIVAGVLILPFLWFSISLYIGHQNGIKAVAYIENGDGQLAFEAFTKAIKKDPFTYRYRLDQAVLLKNSGLTQNDQNQLDMAETQMLKAIEYAPYRMDAYQRLISFYIDTQSYDQAVQFSENLPNLAPYQTQGYEQKFNALVAKATDLLKSGEVEEAVNLYTQALKVEEELKVYNDQIKKPIIFSDNMLLSMNKVTYIMEHIQDVSAINRVNDMIYAGYFNVDADKNNIPDGWRLSLPEGAKLNIISKEENDKGGVILVNEEESGGLLYSNNMSLEPNTRYSIEIEFDEGSSLEDARIALYSRNGTAAQLAPVIPNQLKNVFEFTTTADIESGAQYIRIQHLGRTNETFTVKSITLFKVE